MGIILRNLVLFIVEMLRNPSSKIRPNGKGAHLDGLVVDESVDGRRSSHIIRLVRIAPKLCSTERVSELRNALRARLTSKKWSGR